jgi:hypothetical protein
MAITNVWNEAERLAIRSGLRPDNCDNQDPIWPLPCPDITELPEMSWNSKVTANSGAELNYTTCAPIMPLI